MLNPVADQTIVPVESDAAGSERMAAMRYLSYGVGMIGERVFRDAPALLLLLFMTNYLGIPAAMAGLAIFVPKIFVIVLDPLVGSLSDSLRTRWGRRRPLMFLGAILTSISLIAFFHVPKLASTTHLAIYMGLIITLGFGGYSLFSVPYLTMASEIVSSATERAKLMSCRVIFMAIGLTVGAFSGDVIEFGGGGRQGYFFMSYLFAGLCLVTMLTTVFSTGFARHAERDTESLSIPGQVRLIVANRRYRLLLMAGFLQKLGEGVGYGSFAFFCIYVVEQPLGAFGLVVLAATVGQILAQPAWLWAAKRWSRPTIYNVGVLLWCLNLLAWPLMKGQSQLWLIPLGLESGIAAGGFLMITLSMLSNVIAADTLRTGRNQEGIYSGFWLAMEKVAFALGALIVGVMLQMFGFVEGTQGTQSPQSATAILGIALTYCGFNMAIYLASMIPVTLYRRYEPAPTRG